MLFHIWQLKYPIVCHDKLKLMQDRWKADDCSQLEASLTCFNKMDDNYVTVKLLLNGDVVNAIHSKTRDAYKSCYSIEVGDACNVKLLWTEDLKHQSSFSVNPPEDTVLPYKEASFKVSYERSQESANDKREFARLTGIVKQAATKNLLSDTNSSQLMSISVSDLITFT